MTEDDVPELLARPRHACVVAAAGCGKTEAIARAVKLARDGRQLVLTHTHAGVWALSKRLRQLNVPSQQCAVDTIAGWALKYAASYPLTSHLATDTPVGEDWRAIYGAAATLITTPTIRRVLRSSYAGVYVDEYQDCVEEQHKLILQLASVLPTRVLGDPLQGIFDFDGQRLVDWSTDVVPLFEVLPELVTPWRWRGGNAALGDWLMTARRALLSGSKIPLKGAPILWHPKSRDARWKACMAQAKFSRDSVVAIHKWPRECHSLAGDLRGVFSSMEEMDCRDLLSSARAIQSATTGHDRVLRILEFAARCRTGVPEQTRTLEKALRAGRMPTITARTANPELLHAAADLGRAEDLSAAPRLLRALGSRSQSKLFRRELWREMFRALDFFATGAFATLQEAAWAARSVTRQTGRREEMRSISRTLLVKGLEFDRVVILDGDEHNRKNLYVALTRGRKQLVVLSNEPCLSPT